MAVTALRRARRAALALAVALASAPPSSPRDHVTSPKEQFGLNIGDDYCLANYTQLTDYWKKLDGESTGSRWSDREDGGGPRRSG